MKSASFSLFAKPENLLKEELESNYVSFMLQNFPQSALTLACFNEISSIFQSSKISGSLIGHIIYANSRNMVKSFSLFLCNI